MIMIMLITIITNPNLEINDYDPRASPTSPLQQGPNLKKTQCLTFGPCLL